MKKIIITLFCAFSLISPAVSRQTGRSDIVFLSDFGLIDDAVAQCKAVMLSKNPTARITDMTHNIPPFDIKTAAFFLADSAKLWPKNTVFIAVVDPGVGTERRAIAIKTRSGHYFVGPDNGIFTLVMRDLGLEKAVKLTNAKFLRSKTTTTFHGRDVFAPVAGALSADTGVFDALGPAIYDPISFVPGIPAVSGTAITGAIAYVEIPFGNVWTDIPAALLRKEGFSEGMKLDISVGKNRFPGLTFVSEFGDVPEGSPLLYENSRGLLSLALNCGDMAKKYGLSAGDKAAITFSSAALVDVASMANRHIFLDIRYATANNFTGKRIYPAAKCYLRRPAALALLKAADAAAASKKPFSICVMDCYRPLSVQKAFWEIMPDERYVANPDKGSRHNRGMAVDAAPCDSGGKWLPAPTGYDDFSDKAHRDYKGASAEALAGSAELERVMTQAGFSPLPTEWWHFDYPGWENFPIDDTPIR